MSQDKHFTFRPRKSRNNNTISSKQKDDINKTNLKINYCYNKKSKMNKTKRDINFNCLNKCRIIGQVDKLKSWFPDDLIAHHTSQAEAMMKIYLLINSIKLEIKLNNVFQIQLSEIITNTQSKWVDLIFICLELGRLVKEINEADITCTAKRKQKNSPFHPRYWIRYMCYVFNLKALISWH